jgi:hypothetical protein
MTRQMTDKQIYDLVQSRDRIRIMRAIKDTDEVVSMKICLELNLKDKSGCNLGVLEIWLQLGMLGDASSTTVTLQCGSLRRHVAKR